ncbi:nuclear receptor 2C2-associated protein [Culicoides brevitarsis]|uniref:nuclear receptor 2C2-associated protein n=1 Tax=Culicoides brevitarsis TaxID=469753 RepID=UPI00307C80D1
MEIQISIKIPGKKKSKQRGMTNILKELKYDCRVSSVLNRNNKENGKKYLFDDSDETCWSSDSGTPQFILLDFESVVPAISGVKIQFQGGFAGKDCTMILSKADGTEEIKQDFFPDDINKAQVFNLKESVENVKSIRIVFESSFDFFGRIVIYSLEILR